MAEFIQLHMLASYPPSNLNRDDLGRPKTAMMGGACRLRVSSQSLKRAWRTSEIFKEAFGDHLGIRTKEMGWNIYLALTGGKALTDVLEESDAAPVRTAVAEKNAVAWGQAIAAQFGKVKSVKESKEDNKEKKKKESLCVEQMVHFSPDEIAAIDELISRITRDGVAPGKDDLKLLRKQNSAVDIAMFGRMLAARPEFNQDAAIQVAHAFTVHAGVVEDDYFTAIDDLNPNNGAAHLGETEFASGLFYLYVCINRDLLVENLGGDSALADNALRAIVETMTKISPSGKQNSFASRVYASYLMAEKGQQQPRSLASAYLKPVKGVDLIETAVATLNDQRTKMNAVYGSCSDQCYEMNAHVGNGTLADIMNFVVE